jgi:FKBP-type peptidyl-prolyl cis-trans isomerase FkpA
MSTWFRCTMMVVLPALLLAGCKSQQTSESQAPTTGAPAEAAKPPAPAPAAQPAAPVGREEANVQAARKLGTPTQNPVVASASGLEYIDVKAGTGAEAKAGQTVSVHYTGWLVTGTKFDSSVDRGRPFQFPLGGGQVIRGWDEGVAGMKVGGIRKLIIPSELGYGARDVRDQKGAIVIPANATLIFEVELLGVQ